MGRAPLAISRSLIERLYVEELRSVREIARMLAVSRYVVNGRLAHFGIQVRESDAAFLLQKYFSDEDRQREERDRCRWPGCAGHATGICSSHDAAIAAAGFRCAWPDCTSSASGGLCYTHGKVARGLLA